MNCFNVKELQSLVRNKFFFDTLSTTTLNTTLHTKASTLNYKTIGSVESNTTFNFFNHLKFSNLHGSRLVEFLNPRIGLSNSFGSSLLGKVH